MAFDFAPTPGQSRPEPMSSPPARARVLSVTGGGLLGVIPAAMLLRLESLGRAAHGDDYRLADSFDLVGGTSTGAVIATAVALGLPAQAIVDFYLVDAPKGFRRRRTAIPGLSPLFDSERLHGYFARAVAGRRLRRADLRCDLSVVVKSLSDSAPYLLSSRPATTADCLGARTGGVDLPLCQLLRASTAAPGLFRPQSLPIGPGDRSMACIDGGLSPYNDPCELLWAQVRATAPQCAVLALGTGCGRPMVPTRRLLRRAPLALTLAGMKTMVCDGVFHADAAMRAAAAAMPDRLIYLRHDLPLTADAFAALGRKVDPAQLRQMRDFASPAGKAQLFEAACLAAERAIRTPLPLARAATPVAPGLAPAAA